MENQKLMELCRLNNVGLYLSCHGAGLQWHACESVAGLVRSGFGDSPEIAIAACKIADFQPLKQISEATE